MQDCHTFRTAHCTWQFLSKLRCSRFGVSAAGPKIDPCSHLAGDGVCDVPASCPAGDYDDCRAPWVVAPCIYVPVGQDLISESACRQVGRTQAQPSGLCTYAAGTPYSILMSASQGNQEVAFVQHATSLVAGRQVLSVTGSRTNTNAPWTFLRKRHISRGNLLSSVSPDSMEIVVQPADSTSDLFPEPSNFVNPADIRRDGLSTLQDACRVNPSSYGCQQYEFESTGTYSV